jgi:DNA polymerase V
MDRVFGLADCNNFYVSCERVFRPELFGKPVAVLSNNDGCIISRSDEAKALGIRMGIPAFEILEIIEKNSVHLFSTNYALYGDISRRVMDILYSLVPEMEIYSIDEAFLDLTKIPAGSVVSLARDIRKQIRQWTGIPVSIGVGPTKTLSKVANHMAKNSPVHDGVVMLGIDKGLDDHLCTMPVDEVWGIGDKHAHFLRQNGITSMLDLKNSDDRWIKKELGVMVQRIVLELRGTCCYTLNTNPDSKQEICTSRSFGKPLTTYHELEEATASYVAQVARKLRKQRSLARSLLVFVMTNKYAAGPRYVNYKVLQLPVPTGDTPELIRHAMTALKAIFREGYKYKKSGVIASDLIPEEQPQLSLWDDKARGKAKSLAEAVDRINRVLAPGRLKYAIEGNEAGWKMKQERLSPHHTTRWDDLLHIDMDTHPNPANE